MNWNDEKSLNWINIAMFVFLLGLGVALITYNQNAILGVMSFASAAVVAWRYFQVRNN